MQQKQGRSAMIWACAEKKHNFMLKKALNLEVDEKKKSNCSWKKEAMEDIKKAELDQLKKVQKCTNY